MVKGVREFKDLIWVLVGSGDGSMVETKYRSLSLALGSREPTLQGPLQTANGHSNS